VDRENELKTKVADFWEEKSCGEIYAVGKSDKDYYQSQGKARYELEPYIFDFAKFDEGTNKDVLEIGVGMGADHIEWAKSNPRSLTGVDLTPRAVEHTEKRLSVYGFTSDVTVADAELLPFGDNSFDLVYSWGVLHHSPNTLQAVNEVYRVLRPGGTSRIMIYHKYSLTGYMLWIRFGLLRGRPFCSLDDIYANYLESPGTKAYTQEEARKMLAQFSTVNIKVQLGFGDLLEGAVGQRHGGLLLSVAKWLWPRSLFRAIFKDHGLFLFIETSK
jgi:ubiquinone/menaquinone biosynthesis C-methylase UbiE